MTTTNKPITDLAGEAGNLAMELLRRLDLLAGSGVHEDISYTKYRVLSAIPGPQGSISVGNLGRAIGLAQSTTSEAVARLKKTGLVTKTRNVYDSRAVTVELTKTGHQIVERYRRRVHERYVSLFNGQSPAERATFLSALKQLDTLLPREEDKEREPGPATEAAPCHDTADRWEGQSVRTFPVLQVAQMCRVSHRMIRKWINKFGLPAYRTTGDPTMKITETDLREFSEKLKVYVDWESVDEEE